MRESRLDYIDIHAYWQHPRFPGKPWDAGNWRIPNTPMTAALGGDTLNRLAMHRVAGKPFTVSEYNHPAPSDYRAECMPMLASFAALQDWGGIFQFCYGARPDDWGAAALQSYFRMVTDPAKVAFFPVAANLFRRGDVAMARREARLRIGRERVTALAAEYGNDVVGIWSKTGVARTAPTRHRVAIEWTEGDELSADSVAVPEERSVSSDTDQINWMNPEDGEKMYWVETPKTQVVLGEIADSGLSLGGDIEVEVGETETGWAAFALTSMDDLPLPESNRMLLVIMSKVENQGMGWDEGRNTVGREWGNGPTIAEGVPARLTFGSRDDLVIYALDGTGKRAQKVEAREGSFGLGPEYRTCWYEVAAE